MPMRRNQPASLRFSCDAWSCPFEFKIRLHRVLSMQILVIYIETSYWLNVGCSLSSVLTCVKTCVDLLVSTYVELSLLKNITFDRDSNRRHANRFANTVQMLIDYAICQLFL